MNDELQTKEIRDLAQRVKVLENMLSNHQHNDVDGTKTLRKNIQLDRDQWVAVGPLQQITNTSLTGTSAETFTYSMSLGGDNQTTGFTNKSINMQMNFIHRPQGTISNITAFRKPLATNGGGSTTSVTSGGNTITIAGFNFTTNELAGALISIFDSSSVLVESQTIASNTSTVVTISGTWINTTNNGYFQIYTPVFLGSTDTIFNRLYVQEGTTVGGVRFGVGPTWTSGTAQNGLLYMDATGDLYWRNKSGTAVKLN